MNLKSKKGATQFNGVVAMPVKNIQVKKREDGVIVGVKDGKELGKLLSVVSVPETAKTKDAGHTLKLEELVPAIDPASLVGKDPTTLSQEELIALTTYLTELAGGKVKAAATEEAAAPVKKKPKTKPAAAPVIEDEEEEDEEEDGDQPEYTYEELEAMSVKKLWPIAKPLGIDGVNSRTPKTELVAALAEYFNIEAPEDEEEEAEIEEDAIDDADDADLEEDEFEEGDDEDEEDEEEYEEEDEDEDEDSEDEEEDDEEFEDEDEEEDDSEDDEEEEEDEDDEEEEDDDEDEDEDEDHDLTPEDIDDLDSKEAILAIIKKHNIEIPKTKMNMKKVKAYIKAALFGDDE